MLKSYLVISLIFTATFVVALARSTYDGEPHWESFDGHTSSIPHNAIIGGYENEYLYIIRSAHEGSITPGKFVPSQKKAIIPWNCIANIKSKYEILRGDRYKWVPTYKNYIPQDAIRGGTSEKNNEPLYVCKAKYRGHTIPGKVHGSHEVCYIAYGEIEKGIERYEILVGVKERKPLVRGETSKTVLIGQPVKIVCSILEGVPKPTITWQFNGKQIMSKVEPDNELSISKVDEKDAGIYKCIAQNKIGSSEDSTRIIVQISPKIISSTSDVYQAVETKNPTLTIPCKATGYPKPTITWKLYNAAIHPNMKFSVKDGALIINKPMVSDSQKYECEAKNEVGSTKATFVVDIHQVPEVSGEFDITAIRGASISIKCRILKGAPKPMISWQFQAKGESKLVSISGSDTVWHISRVDSNNAGSYKCIADNGVGKSEHITTLTVLRKPLIRGETSKTVLIGQPVKIVCSILEGVPKPTITWQFNGKQIMSKVEPDNELSISKVDEKDAGIYKCIAQNKIGSSEDSTMIIVQIPPKIISSTSDVYQAVETKNPTLTIPCKATGYPKPTITWKLYNAAIHPNVKFSVKDGALIINKPMVSDSQKYECEAKNEVGSTKATFVVDIHQVPEVSGELDMTAIRGESISIKCRILKGAPKPMISWQFQAKGESKLVSISGSDTVWHISRVDSNNAGRYKCIADNGVGKSEHITTLTVLIPPVIISNPSEVYTSVEGKDDVLLIPCSATGFPKPIVTWKLNNVIISHDSKFAIDNGNLVIKKPTVSDSKIYTCEVKSVAGTDHANFKVEIHRKPLVRGETSKTVLIGQPVKIVCSILKGVPKPTITWQFNGKQIMSKVEPDNELSISKVDEKDAGIYKCIAQNKIGSSEDSTRIIVQIPPKIISRTSNVYQAVETKNPTLTIPCKATGYPKPTITWKLYNAAIHPNVKFSVKDGALIINKPMVSDSQKYECEAKNEVGSTKATFVVDIHQVPEVSGKLDMTAIRGASISIKCRILKGAPKPMISWQFQAKGESKLVSISGSDTVWHISRVDSNNAGSYKCIADNGVGKSEHFTTLTVLIPPAIISNPSEVYTSVEGNDDVLLIPCSATGFPKPIVTWKLNNGQTISHDSKFAIDNGSLVIKKPTVSDSKIYTCEVKSDAGTDHANFKVEIHRKPLVRGETSKTVLIGQHVKIVCSILEGVPKPTITWQFNGKQIMSKVEPDNELSISKIDEKDAGIYKCIAQNKIGSSEDSTRIIVQIPPKIISSTSNVYQAVETKNPTLTIPCKATGYPKPTITWKLYNAAIHPNVKFSVKDGALIINKPKVSDSQKYKCEAKNEVGSMKATFVVDIHQVPEVSGELDMTAIRGESISIKCRILKGAPKPMISWQFQAKGESKLVSISGSDTVWHISRVDSNNAGSYKCIADNGVGKSEHITTLTVLIPPAIISNPSEVYTSVEGKDDVLLIPCSATGFPKPIVTWKLNNVIISHDSKFAIDNGSLVIKKPTVSDSKMYTCEVKSDAGTDHANFKVEIHRKPLVRGETSKTVLIGQPVKIVCSILEGVPKPTITWQFNGKQIMSKVEPDNELSISKVDEKHAGIYKCIAQNKIGSSEDSTRIIVQIPPKIISSTSNVYQAVETKNPTLTIPCKATGYPKPTITWKLYNAAIHPNVKFSVKDGALIINKPMVSDSQKYECEAKNEVGSTKATFVVDIHQVPEVSGELDMTAIRGESISIKCRILKGAPKPMISWQFQAKGESKLVSISGSDTVWHISRVDSNNAGSYKCIADNGVGKSEHITTLTVLIPPAIISNPSEVYTSVEGKDDVLLIPCSATGFPKPIVTWKLNNVIISHDSKFAIVNGSLVIKKPTVSDSKIYTCEVKSDAGTDHANFKVEIHRKPLVRGETSKTVLIGQPVKIVCSILEGVPKPTITWQFNGKQIMSKVEPDNELSISKVDEKDAGIYKCIAQNKIGSSEDSTRIIVQIPPKIISSTSDVYQAVETKNPTLTIPCKATGYPKPTITWKLYNAAIQPSVKFSVKDGALIINKPMVSDSQKYECEAKNEVGSTKAMFVVDIHQVPEVSGELDMTAIRGESISIKCRILKGAPKPMISWQFQAKGESKLVSISGSDTVWHISRVDSNNAGSYKCIADNGVGKSEHITTLTVLIPPAIISNQSEVYTSVEGKDDVLLIPCSATGFPKPVVTWKLNNVIISHDSKFAIDNGSLVIKKPTVSDSKMYTCEVKSDAGTDHANFKVEIHLPPKIISSTSDVYQAVETKNPTLTIPCKATGYPKPTITWKLFNAAIHPSVKFSVKDGALIINKPMVSDSQKYECEAKNEVGSTKATFVVDIHQVPEVSGELDMTAIRGESISIKCRILKGAPKPMISWQFQAKGESKLVSISGSDTVWHISRVDSNNAGSYKCIADNGVGKSEHITTLTVLIPPAIISNPSEVYTSVEGKDDVLLIPCSATGFPKPIVTWKLNNVIISHDSKFAIDNGSLVIKKPTVSDSKMYTCEVKSDAGTDHANFKVEIHQRPEVMGSEKKTVASGNSVQIECKVIKGVPNPKISWQVKYETSAEYLAIPGSDQVLHLSNVVAKHAGIYKCIAHNIAGDSAHLTTLTVEYAPIIKSKNETVYTGIEGDVALRVPCLAVGVPEPVINWSLDGVNIIPNEHYVITDGALIIKDPKKNDSKLYTCEAKNYLGQAQASFRAAIDQFFHDFGTVEEVNILKGATANLECASTDSQSVRWFIEGIDSGIKGNYFNLKNVDESFEGNYTCRISDMNDTHSITYAVIVGFSPTFSFEQEDSTFDWSGNEWDELNCDVEAKPSADIVWTFNGKVVVGQNSTTLRVSGNWGHYTCEASNIHGAIHRNFDVISSECLIPRKSKDINMPLILTETYTWPVLDSTTDYLKLGPGQTVVLSCPNHGDHKNSLKILSKFNEISAVCDKQDILTVDGKQYKISDLQCTHDIEYIINEKPTQCLTESSKLIQVGYEVHGFLEIYEVCFDVSKNIPLYARTKMSKSNSGRPVTSTWSWNRYPGVTDALHNNETYTCKDSTSKCCYSKTQLVNARDIGDGPAQKSSFLDPLNVVPYWRPCDIDESPWEIIEDMFRARLNIYDEFVTWSGTHLLQEKNGGVVSRYLWKVVRFDEEEAIAIVYVNGPSPSAVDELCKNTCVDEGTIPWINKHNKYTYCCDLNEFLQTFNISGSTIGAI